MKEAVVFFGAGPYVLPIIDVLSKNFDLKLVLTTEKNNADPVPDFCSKNGIRYETIHNFDSQILTQIKQINAKFAVLASFGQIIPAEVLSLFEKGIINIHPSLLPKYRGATPVQAAIIEGESKTGVSIIRLDEELDHGPILSQVEEKIEPDDTSDSLYNRLFKKGAQLLPHVIVRYISGKLKPQEQDHSKATFTERLTRQSGFIDLNDKRHATGEKLDQMIRAYHPWPGVWFKTELNGNEKIIKLLPENKLQVEGKKSMSIKDFINGYAEGSEIIGALGLSST